MIQGDLYPIAEQPTHISIYPHIIKEKTYRITSETQQESKHQLIARHRHNSHDDRHAVRLHEAPDAQVR